jgi:ribosome maturation protein SDO1
MKDMVSVEKAVIAKLMRAGQKFEILVDPVLALEVMQGKEVPADSLLAVPEVFEDVKKGSRPAGTVVNKAFGTNDIYVVAKKIIRDGEVQLTTDQRHKMMEEKTKAIAAIISRNGINPQTGVPHPQDRILRTMEEAKVRIDINKRAEEQVDAVMEAIRVIIPIRFETVKVAIKVPPQYAGRAVGIIRNFGTPSREEYGADGSYLCVLEVAAGIQADIYDKLNSLTHGEVQVKKVEK